MMTINSAKEKYGRMKNWKTCFTSLKNNWGGYFLGTKQYVSFTKINKRYLQ